MEICICVDCTDILLFSPGRTVSPPSNAD
uniref:Uncharacterized protein n=1 Tax=Anguilla anguilla TaxID=7936 RepID=A0A0E9RNU4_ANGAN